jgi:hypothetical protein
MSHQLIDRSPDLKRLRDEGYEVEIRSQHLLVHGIPYLNATGTARRGTLVSDLTMAGDVTARPGSHITYFIGEHPCRKDGTQISQIKHGTGNNPLAPDIMVNHSFSNKPANGYANYYEKMTTYIAIISAPAQSVDPSLTAKTFKLIESSESDSVFKYLDTSSSRAGIGAMSAKFKGLKIAIIGLGGTGSYTLDLVAKTEVAEIHLYDKDKLLQHNAFRSPAAPSQEELFTQPPKVAHYYHLYSKMRRGIVPHETFVDESNVHELADIDYVFVCVDKGSVKRPIIATLQAAGIPFIDVGMGVHAVGDKLWATLRVTTSSKKKTDHVPTRISLSDDDDDKYSQNIQIADLNCLNAALAVLKWKKLCGFYLDEENEHNSTYTTSINLFTSEDRS